MPEAICHKLTVMILDLQTDRFGQTVQTQMSAPRGAVWSGSSWSLFALFEVLHHGETFSLNFWVFTIKLVDVKKFRNFTLTCIFHVVHSFI